MTTHTPSMTMGEIIAERDRLKVVNAELVEGIKMVLERPREQTANSSTAWAVLLTPNQIKRLADALLTVERLNN